MPDQRGARLSQSIHYPPNHEMPGNGRFGKGSSPDRLGCIGQVCFSVALPVAPELDRRTVDAPLEPWIERRKASPMISQFFEIQIAPGQERQYLDLAASLKPKLDAMGGCLFLDRYRSLRRENVLLSYQVWQDEGALTAWRVNPAHHAVQVTGREKVFADYRIRIAQVIHEARPQQPAWRPERLTPYNDPVRRPPTYVLASESKNAELPAKTTWPRDGYTSVYREGYFAHVIDLPDVQSGLEFGPGLFADPTTEHFRIFEVIRDYGMYDRAEAPQYYPAINRNVPKP